MQAPKLPSFFKALNSKSFSFKSRYYDEQKERQEELKKEKITNIRFRRDYTKKGETGRNTRIILLIIILSLLSYKLIIN